MGAKQNIDDYRPPNNSSIMKGLLIGTVLLIEIHFALGDSGSVTNLVRSSTKKSNRQFTCSF